MIQRPAVPSDGVSDQSYLGIVVAADGTTPGPASGMTYDIVINREDGGQFYLTGIAPVLPRWPDAVNCVRHEEGQRVMVQRSRGTYYMLTPEMPSIEECEEGETEE